ncbi:hypothetical protein [Geobacter sp.]|uniref:hypothetical protein n=1 Tax=Geobacter sp. TaxID=46610 RepID=UPI002632015C|nr:hypothetical protein [Geobacter sp.]
MKQTLTKAEWAQVEERLNRAYCPVALMCDGYHLTIRIERIKMQLVIGFHVNGVFRGAWMSEDCEERRRFFRPVKKSAWNAASRARMKKMSKRALKQMKVDPSESFTVHYPWWTSFKALKSHLQKHNESIELLQDWRYEVKQL